MQISYNKYQYKYTWPSYEYTSYPTDPFILGERKNYNCNWVHIPWIKLKKSLYSRSPHFKEGNHCIYSEATTVLIVEAFCYIFVPAHNAIYQKQR